MKTKIHLSVCLGMWLMLSLPAFSQDKIILLNSKEITNIKVTGIESNIITYQELNKNNKEVKMYTDKVFAINYADGTEKILYKPDTAMGDFSPEQMRMFLRGTKDAREKYKNNASYFIGFGLGLIGPIVGSVTFPVLLPFPPAAGVFLAGLGSPNINKQPVEKKYWNNIEYRQGYERKARGKKTKHALLGTTIGVLVGIAVIDHLDFNQFPPKQVKVFPFGRKIH